MRPVLVVALLLLAAPAHAEYWHGDNLLSCLVGKGAVEMRHGSTASEALETVADACIDAHPEPEDETGDYLDYVYGSALGSLEAIGNAEAIF